MAVAVGVALAVAVGVGVATEAAPPLAAPVVPVPPCFSVLAAACIGTIVTKSANVRQPAMYFIHVFFFMYVASLKFDDLTITQEFVRQMKKQCHFFGIFQRNVVISKKIRYTQKEKFVLTALPIIRNEDIQ